MIDFKAFGLLAAWLLLTRPVPRWQDIQIIWHMTVCGDDIYGTYRYTTGQRTTSVDRFFSLIKQEHRRQNPVRVPLPAGVKADWLLGYARQAPKASS